MTGPHIGMAEQAVGCGAGYSRPRRAAFLFVLFLIGTSNFADRNIIGVLLEPIRLEFHVRDTQLGLLSGLSFALFYATLGIPAALWADRGDRKRIITIALTLWSVMTALCGFAHTFWQLAAARVGVGVGEAGAIPAAQSLIADYYLPEQRGRAIGVFTTSSTAGYVLALVLGGWIAGHYGWRAAFLVIASLGLLIVPLSHLVLREPRRRRGAGAGVETGESLVAALRFLAVKPSYRLVLLGIVLYFFMAYGALVFTVPFMMRSHSYTVAQAGGLFGTIAAVGALIGSLGGGAISDRFAQRDVSAPARVAAYGMLCAWPACELALIASGRTLMAIWLTVALIAISAAVPAMFTTLHTVCGSKRRAMAVALAFFFANLLGLGIGPVITGFISDHLASVYGSADGLRYALMVVFGFFIPASWVMLLAVRYIRADAER